MPTTTHVKAKPGDVLLLALFAVKPADNRKGRKVWQSFEGPGKL